MNNDSIKKNSSQTFLKGAFIMSASLIIVKLMGMLYKVWIARIYSVLGADYALKGSGLLSNAYDVYIPLFTIATAGFPIAVSRLISESIAQKRYKDLSVIHKVSKPFFVIMGAICFALMIGISFIYVNIIKSPYSIYSMMTLAPSVFFGCLVSIYRGYYEGQRNMFPTALSEIVEIVVKVISGLSLASLLIHTGLNEYSAHATVFGKTFESEADAMYTLLGYSVASAIAGISIGSFFSFLFLRIYYRYRKFQVPKEYLENSVDARTQRETFILILKTAIPVGLAALVMSFSSTIDSTIIQNVLYKMAQTNRDGLISQYSTYKCHDDIIKSIPLHPTEDNPITVHTYLKGSYDWAATIMQLVTALTQAFGTSAMPSVTAAYTKGEKTEIKKSIETVLKLTMLFTLPAGLGLFAIPYPIVSLIYGEAGAEIAANVLRILGISVIFIAASTPICSMLQGVGRIDMPLKLYSVAMIMKILLNYLFVSMVSINIMGAAIGSLVAYLFVCVVGMYFLIKKAGVVPDFISTTIKPLIGAVCCAGGAYLSYKMLSPHISSAIATILSIVIAAIIYLVVLLLLHTFTENEVKMLPKSKNLVTLLAKLHLLG